MYWVYLRHVRQGTFQFSFDEDVKDKIQKDYEEGQVLRIKTPKREYIFPSDRIDFIMAQEKGADE